MHLHSRLTSLAACFALLTAFAACDINLGNGDGDRDRGDGGTDDGDGDGADDAANEPDEADGSDSGGGETPDADDPADDTGDEAGGEAGGEEGGGDGLSCAQMWECYVQCEVDACVEDCYFMGSPEGQSADDALFQCQLDNDCWEVECLERDCFPELEGCFGPLDPGGEPPPDEPPAGSWLCYADGTYEVCDTEGFCSLYTATGAGIGVDESEAGFAAVSDCTEHMLNMIIINNINGSASQVSACAVTWCSEG